MTVVSYCYYDNATDKQVPVAVQSRCRNAADSLLESRVQIPPTA